MLPIMDCLLWGRHAALVKASTSARWSDIIGLGEHDRICLTALRMVDHNSAPGSEIERTETRAVQPELQSYQEGCPSPYTAGVLTALMAYLAVFAPGLGAVPWVLNSELFTSRVGTGLHMRSAVCQAWQSAGWVTH